MPIETNLDRDPYNDDYVEEKDFAKILFLPDIPVQVRELNQLQTMFQKQVERFGDAVYKRGTIVDGCNFIFKDSFPYAKLDDLETDGTPTIPSTYVGQFARANSGLTAFITDYEDGFEATDPDLKTIYFRYINSGDSGTVDAFSPEDTLTIYDANTSLHKVRVVNGGLAFANTDRLVVTPAIVVNVSTGTFTNGEYITQDSLASNLQIVWIDDVSLALSGQVILGLKPRGTDLANATVNTSIWAVSNNESIKNVGNTVAATVESVLGGDAEGGIVTDGSGRVLDVILTQPGRGYANVPWVSVRSSNNAAGIAALDLEGQNYRAKVKVGEGATAVGNGYAFGITKGVIYQKGYFLRVSPQTVLVSKYDQSPNNVVVGFDSVEEIIDANEDPSLNDPQTNDAYDAPGADRLRIRPELKVVDKEDVTPEDGFFPIVEWSEGQPTKINEVSVYSNIGDEMARRTADEAGDFVVDRFNVTTRSPSNNSLEGTRTDVVIDPGKAYVSGFKVETTRNTIITIDKATDNLVSNVSVTLAYGSYVRVNEIGGSFQFPTGDVVSLRGTAAAYLTSHAASISAPGSEIGVARARSLVYESGVPGTPSAVYRLYLFDIRMGVGKNFRDVRSLYYAGTNKGIADVVLDLDGTTSANVAVLRSTSNSGLLFASGAQALKNANNATYIYRTNHQTATVANTGLLVESLASNPNEFFLRTGPLTDDEMQDLYVVPLANLRFTNSLSGTIALTATSPNAVGTSTSFVTELAAGDYVKFTGNSTENVYRRVVSVVNNTLVILDSNSSFANTATSGNRVFPQNVPVPFGTRAGLSANVDANGNIMTLNFGSAFQGSASVNVAFTYDVQRRGVTPGTKTAARDRFVKIACSNNAGNTVGPWCLGIPDAFRLKAVYVGTSSGVSNTDVNAIDDFLIDSNQNQDFLDHSYLVRRPGSKLNLTSSDWLLVQFDHFTVGTPGFYATPSYVSANAEQVAIVDAMSLASLGTQVSTYEIPSVYTAAGKTYDLVNTLDFRPSVTNTVASATTAGTANVNPNSSISFGNTADPTNDKRFPFPGGLMTFTSDQYLGRRDSVIIGVDGNIAIHRGIPAVDPNKRYSPSKPNDSMLLDVLNIPPYPTLPQNPSDTLSEVLLTRRINEKGDNVRIRDRSAAPALTPTQLNLNQPARFTQSDIGSLSRRIDALEYYTALTLLETSVKDRIIPSSVDPATNRFKFGFFVDDYNSDTLLDTDNPQHAASIEEGRLVPDKMEWEVVQDPGGFQVPPYIDFPLVDQDYATGGAVNTCVSNTITSNVVLYAKNPDSKRGWRYAASEFDYVHTQPFSVANAAGTITIYFDNHNAADKLVIYRGNTEFKTVADSVTISSSEKTMLKGNTFNRWFSSFPGKDRVLKANGFYTGTGKITWTHNPSLGNDYTILVGKGKGSHLWRYAVQYPVATTTVTCTPDPDPNPSQGIYDGVMVIEDLKRLPKRNEVGSKEYKTGTAHIVTCTGLKPNTRHDFYVEGSLHTTMIIRNSALANPATDIITDASGKVVFTCNLPPVTRRLFGSSKKTWDFKVSAPNSKCSGKTTTRAAITLSFSTSSGYSGDSASGHSSSAGYGYGSQSGGAGYSSK